MIEWIKKIFDWIINWDWITILYSAIGSALLLLIIKWLGLFQTIKLKYRTNKGIQSYRKALYEICSTLIVIGRRQGFSMKQVFIPLDFAPSDLMQHQSEIINEHSPFEYGFEESMPISSFVLVGGPGAGKSTLVKNYILRFIRTQTNSIPFFIRLREYDGSISIEDFLIEQLHNHNIPNAKLYVRRILKSYWSFCVLDGLDEVRPNIRNLVYQQINSFYSKFFINERSKTLIVTCRKEAYRNIPLDIPNILEVRPLSDEQIVRFSQKWPLGFPTGKSSDTFWKDLVSSPRILDLVRSPLLLVGGLMQYTESNLGIPEERVEYLARIGRWLVTDWATAQGFPPDPYRSVYPRILPKIAIGMHTSQQSEWATEEVIKIIENYLPSYGFAKEEAKGVLENILTRTGILVRDIPGIVIFAQFGLQEYYSSTDAIHHFGINEFAIIQPKLWWREVILLAAAQEREPSKFLEELYKNDPLLASAAVAECPTPGIEFQDMAINACIKGIDDNQKTAQNSAVAILKKVKGIQEERFISALEKRLSVSNEISSSVGIILATADTIACSSTLARHPSIWDVCLQEAGFLSAGFEKLLVSWIKSGDDKQSMMAADLLASRLSSDRFEELINLLPSLPEKRAEHLAILLLYHIEFKENRTPVNNIFLNNIIEVVSKCTPYINDKISYLKKIKKHPPYKRMRKFGSVSIFLSQNSKPLKQQKIFYILASSVQWYQIRSSYLYLFASGISIISYFQNYIFQIILLITSIIFYIWGIIIHSSRKESKFFPFRIPFRRTPSKNLEMIFIGSLFVLSLGARFNSFNIPDHFFFLCLSLLYSLTSFVQINFELFPFDIASIFPYLTRIISVIWIILLCILVIICFIYPALFGFWILAIASILIFYLIFDGFRLYYPSTILLKAINRLEVTLENV